jgi:hypothetical protein
MGGHRYRAPTANGAVLAQPPFDAIPELIEENRRSLDRDDVRLDESWNGTLRRCRNDARMMAIVRAWSYLERPFPYKPGTIEPDHIPTVSDAAPLIVAGHQPELFHPGVWVKNFALAGLAKRLGGVGLNLIVDNDTVKSTAVRVPVVRGPAPTDVGTVPVPFDTAPQIPFEEYRVARPDEFDRFADRVAGLLPPALGEPLVRRVWAEVRRRPDKPVGEAISAARRALEREWGCDNLELPVSHLAGSESFVRFAVNIGRNAARFAEVYNAAVGRYRANNGIRGSAHPVPDLERDGDWQEVPLWAWTARDPRRGRVWVKSETGRRLSFRFDSGPAGVTIPVPFAGYGPETAGLMNDALRLRPRALTLTLYARVCLGDFFIHGIGGGKYDEVTDAIIRDYFGIAPPAYQVLSATLHLPLPGFPSTPADLRRAQRRVRDLFWNPQRHLSAEHRTNPEVMALVAECAALAGSEPPLTNRSARRDWFHRLRAVAGRLRPFVSGQVPGAAAELIRVRNEVTANAILQRRDYSWALYPEDVLRPALQRFLTV